MSIIDQAKDDRSKKEQNQIPRREFLKLGGLGILSMCISPFLSPVKPKRILPDGEIVNPEIGRILKSSVVIYNQPSYTAKKLKTLNRDTLLPIIGATIGDEEPAYNRIWYEVKDQGYIHSGSVQPVKARLNPAFRDIPKEGVLVELTVPYTDAYWDPEITHRLAYRLYYGTTYWVNGALAGKSGKVWYRIQDDRFGSYYYANATHFHIVSDEEILPLGGDVADEDKRIEVILESQLVIAYEKELPVFMTRAATGARFSNGDFSTPPGRYITDRKRSTRHMSYGDRAASNSYDLPGVPWVSYLNIEGISFHGTYWHNDFGRPRSHGCINLSNEAARWIYRWTLPSVPLEEHYFEGKSGTVVDVLVKKELKNENEKVQSKNPLFFR